MHLYRTHTCGDLRVKNNKEIVRISGWIHRKRNHGNILFIDLRDYYGITQCIIQHDNALFELIASANLESVVTITGSVLIRSKNTINSKMPTGEIEVLIDDIIIESPSNPIPIQINSNVENSQELRLKYRFLDLRRQKMKENITLRSKVISSIRNKMIKKGFIEIQTPILTSSSPEGARDFIVPSRLHPGKFYALPQAPQQFKQLLMISGFDKYFQIAPCFRDEDARADRTPGEFYQLDFEMSFVTQEDIFNTLEPILYEIFTEFSNKKVSDIPFPRIPFAEAIKKYGTDKPDLRNPIENYDVTDIFKNSGFSIFANAIKNGAIVIAIPAPKSSSHPRNFFNKIDNWAKEKKYPGLGYISFEKGNAKGPIAKHLENIHFQQLKKIGSIEDGDSVFFACDTKEKATELASIARNKVAKELDIIEKDSFRFCWIVDYPMFEYNEEFKKIDFSHNPFSMPQGGLNALKTLDPLDIKAYQYDIVCNGIELSSGAIRNHLPEITFKAFSIAGYSRKEVKDKFKAIINALSFGSPPHGGCAPGIDRMIMLLLDEPNLREVIAFPMNQQAQDLLMQAPNSIYDSQLKELNIKVDLKKN